MGLCTLNTYRGPEGAGQKLESRVGPCHGSVAKELIDDMPSLREAAAQLYEDALHAFHNQSFAWGQGVAQLVTVIGSSQPHSASCLPRT